ncbi:MAG: DnaJ domain-containing protein [Magnetococcales bacterium]|nr:DnaJ domain-containing protein [Magnetococcales bacterium]
MADRPSPPFPAAQGESLSRCLLAILEAHPAGLKEFDLLQHLRRELPELFPSGALLDSLEMFQTHFLLFHLLYRLRDQLRAEQRGELAIHCLDIRLHPWRPAENNLPGPPDPLRAYYLDVSRLEGTTRREVEGMLADFWTSYDRWDRRVDSLAALGLPLDAPRETIRRRWRELAKSHHPDHGGDPEAFRRVAEAASQLLGSPAVSA